MTTRDDDTGRTEGRSLNRLRVSPAVAVTAGVLAGAVLGEALVSWRSANRRPLPGILVDVDGARLHVRLGGSDTGPAVIFEAGLGGSSGLWTLVEREVRAFARTVSYDRAGYGYSSFGKLPRVGMRMAAELRQALARAHVEPPFVLVTHSFGGLISRLFASQYPKDVKAVVFVDALHGVVFDEAQRVMRRVIQTWGVMLGGMSLLGALGILRLAAHIRGPHVLLGLPPLPPNVRDELADSLPKDVIAALLELFSWEATLAEAEAATLPADMPVTVISHDREAAFSIAGQEPSHYERLWQAVQRDSLRLTSRVMLKKAKRSGHHILLEDPQDIVESVRAAALA